MLTSGVRMRNTVARETAFGTADGPLGFRVGRRGGNGGFPAAVAAALAVLHLTGCENAEHASSVSPDGGVARAELGSGPVAPARDTRGSVPPDAAPHTGPPEVGRTFVYDCGIDVSFTVRTGPGELALWLPASLGGTYTILAASPPESTERYQEGDLVVSLQGDTATLELGGQTHADCRSNPAKVPWADAARRGASFRAVGNDPAWALEIYPERIALVTEPDAERIELPLGDPVTDGLRTTYRATADRHELTAIIERWPCADTITGEGFDAVVVVTFDARTFYGCGRAL